MRNPAAPAPRKPVERRPNLLNAAAQALRRKRPADAEKILIGVLALSPRNPDALRLLGIAQQSRGNYAAAIATLRDALAIRPNDPLILNNLGSALRSARDFDGAIAAFRQATELNPALTAAWFNLGKALKSESHLEQAQEAFERALQCNPDYASAWGSLGDVLKSLGDIDRAIDCYRKALRYPQHAPRTWHHLANLKTVRLSSGDVVALRQLLEIPGLSEEDRIFAGYAFSKALEDQQDYAGGFAALQSVSALKRRKVSWNAPAFSARISAIDAAFARPKATAADVTLGQEVIFVMSLPRSGSTLTEHILASHSLVEGANELPHLEAVIYDECRRRGRDFPEWVDEATADDWQRLGQDYLARADRWRRDKPRFTDKGLSNWQYVGAAVAMLPGARFVNCRRDPVETCLSCYRQLFSKGNHFSYDLVELGAYWRDYDRINRAWQLRYPERVFEQIYEDLLADPEAQIRRLLGFLGLPFEPACMQSHLSKRAVRTFSAAQVRQPLQSNTARAHRYGVALDPLREALRNVGATNL
jgi:tetratricopeptide (TPR) repeat protein